MSTPVLTCVIVGQQDHPIYEVDLTGPKEVRLSDGAAAAYLQGSRRFSVSASSPTAAARPTPLTRRPPSSCCSIYRPSSRKPSTSTSSSCTRRWTRSRTRRTHQRMSTSRWASCALLGGARLSAALLVSRLLPQHARTALRGLRCRCVAFADLSAARPDPTRSDVLQIVDRFNNNLFVSAFLTPGGTKFLLLHDGKADDSVRSFFYDVYELYVRVRALGCLPGRGVKRRAALPLRCAASLTLALPCG